MTHVSIDDLLRAGASGGDVPQLASRAAELRALWQQDGGDRAREKLLEKSTCARQRMPGIKSRGTKAASPRLRRHPDACRASARLRWAQAASRSWRRVRWVRERNIPGASCGRPL
jgi:hypothetical protein